MAKNDVLRQWHLPAYPSIDQTTDALNVKRPRPSALLCYSICKTGQLTSIATLPFQKTNRYAVVGQIVIRFLSNLAQKSIVTYPEFMQAIDYEFEIDHQIPTRVRDKTLSLCLLLRSTGWRESHFFTCPILFRGHGFLSQTRQLTLPSFAFSWFRECAF